MRYRLIITIGLILGLNAFLVACPASDQSMADHSHRSWHLSRYIPRSFHSSLWSAMSDQFRLEPHMQQRLVQKQIRFLARRQDYVNELTRNAKPYLFYIFEQTQKRNMPAELALLPMIESDYNPFVYSSRGATGLWQMMPGTGSGFGLKINWWYDGRRDITASTNAALKYLAYLHDYFGNWLLAIAAYDSGEGTVKAAIRHNRRLHKPIDFWSLPLPKETKSYVPKLLALATIIEHPRRYHLHLNPIRNRPYFSAVKMHGQIDLNRVSKLADTNVKTIRQLNPGFRRWATIPNGSYTLLLPIKKALRFTHGFNQSQRPHVTWLHHHVKTGESLSLLANQYHTTVSVLQRVNNIKGTVIHVGQDLLIPRSFHGHFAKTFRKQRSRIAEDRIPGPKRIVEIVRNNDTLWSIARRHHVTPNQIRYWNQLTYHSRLRRNQQLVLWKKHHYRRSSAQVYKVRSGDNLSRIAKRFHTRSSTLKSANHLNTSVLQIGQKLVIR